MCLYIPNKELLVAKEDIFTLKVLKKTPKGFLPYFDSSCKNLIELDTLLTNDSPIRFHKTENPWPCELIITEGVFHTFENGTPILNLIKYSTKEYLIDRQVYVAEATIPKGTKYVLGFSHCFSLEIEETYGSDKIIYSNPIPILEFKCGY